MLGPCRAFWLAITCLLCAGCGGARPAASGAPGAGGLDPTRTVDFELPDLDGHPVRLSDYRGRVVLVNYFATWCQPCLSEIPALKTLVEGEKAVPGLVVIGISVDLQADQLLKPFAEYMEMHYPVLRADEAMIHGRTPFGDVPAIPVSFLIDPSGHPVESFVGMAPVEYIRRRAAEIGGGR